MINKRLIQEMAKSKKYIYYHVLCQWTGLICQIIIIILMSNLFDDLFTHQFNHHTMVMSFLIIIIMMIIRYFTQISIAKFSHTASVEVKSALRTKIYNKLIQLETKGHNPLSTSEVVQLTVEGIDQLEIYFGRYLPQFIYSMIAPLTLFIFLSTISFKVALVLLICVPLIPISIVLVQKFAKKLLSKYWGLYTNLGDRFLDNIRGLTTLKIYSSDRYMHQKMNEEAEKFRKATMKVLIMQLNSISIMDLVAFGGAAIGIILTINSYLNQQITIGEAFTLMMLSAEFFIPLRLLGSFFHIAMNGNAASTKIFKLLDMPVVEREYKSLQTGASIQVKNVSFGYDTTPVLKSINLNIDSHGLIGIVGKSGCGKSTLVSLLMNRFESYEGEVKLFGTNLKEINQIDLAQRMVLVSHDSYLFKGTVRSNLLMANSNADDKMLINVLKQVNLYDYFNQLEGLNTAISEKGSNLSGGQLQRLCLARALLVNGDIYIFDEATSNIDIESENDIMKVVYELSKSKIVLVISHRLENVVKANQIVVLKYGKIIEQGSHEQLMKLDQEYASMYETQYQLENYFGGEVND